MRLKKALSDYLLVGGYPRAIGEFYEQPEEGLSDARYISDIYELVISDIIKFENYFKRFLKNKPSSLLRTMLIEVLKRHQNPAGVIGESFLQHIGGEHAFFKYLSDSFSIAYLYNFGDVEYTTNIPHIPSFSLPRKYFYQDPLVFWSFYFGSRDERRIYSQAKKLLKTNTLIRGYALEAVVLAHLLHIQHLQNTRHSHILFSFFINKNDELCDALLTYLYGLQRCVIPLEVSHISKDPRRLHILSLREEFRKRNISFRRVLMINNDGYLAFQSNVVYVLIELFLLFL